MPQLDQIDTFISQIFWLFVSFGIIYFYISRFASPKISDTLKKRQILISSDLDNAKLYKEEMDKITKDFKQKLSTAKSESLKITSAASTEASSSYSKEMESVEKKLKEDIEKSQSEISSAKDKAMSELKTDISSFVEDVVKSLSDIKVKKSDLDKKISL